MITLLAKSGNDSVEAYRQKALKSLDRLPPLAPAVGQLLSKLAFREVNYGELTSLVEKDALLCAHILKTVNSAAFGRSKSITSVTQAMTMLGTNTLRRIAIGFTFSNLFTRNKMATSFSRMRFNMHSGATGIFTEALLEALPSIKSEGAFVAGMLHDLGRLLIAVGLPDRYETIATMHAVSEKPVFACEQELLGLDHAELSYLALRKWGLPEFLCEAVGCHHRPDDEHSPALAVVLHRADRFVNHLGISVMPPPPMVGQAPTLAIPGFKIDEAAVLDRFERDWKQLAAFFA